MPGLAHWAGFQAPVGICVIDKPLGLETEGQPALQSDGDVSDMTENVTRDCGVNGAKGFRATLDAVQEIAGVV
jgi:hypothetical protein